MAKAPEKKDGKKDYSYVSIEQKYLMELEHEKIMSTLYQEMEMLDRYFDSEEESDSSMESDYDEDYCYEDDDIFSKKEYTHKMRASNPVKKVKEDPVAIYLKNLTFGSSQHAILLDYYEPVSAFNVKHQANYLNKIFDDFNVKYKTAIENNYFEDGEFQKSFSTENLIVLAQSIYANTMNLFYDGIKKKENVVDNLNNHLTKTVNSIFFLYSYCYNLEKKDNVINFVPSVGDNSKDAKNVLNFLSYIVFIGNRFNIEYQERSGSKDMLDVVNMLHALKNKYGPLFNLLVENVSLYNVDSKFLTLEDRDLQEIEIKKQKESLNVDSLVQQLKLGKKL